MKPWFRTLLFCTLSALLPAAYAQEAAAPTPPAKKKLAITKIEANDALRARMNQQGRAASSLDSVIQSLDPQLYDRLLNTRRFEILERADADALAKESAAAGNVFQFKQADYVLTIRIDGFNDLRETRKFETLNKTVASRTLELSAIAKVTEVSTQRAIASANFVVTKHDAETRSEHTLSSSGESSDTLLTEVTREMAQKIAARVADAVYPARVLAKRDKTVTINRNDESGVRVGQEWEIFAPGQELVDPDTGEKSREEVLVGRVRISRVNPQNSQAEILEDLGIDKGAYARLKDANPPETRTAQ